MNDADIIKALEHCSQLRLCDDCPICMAGYFSFSRNACRAKLMEEALDLINRQKAEIERLQKYNADMAHKHYNDGIKEFAERLKKSAFDCDVSFGYGVEHYTEAVAVVEIDNLVKEMTGE